MPLLGLHNGKTLKIFLSLRISSLHRDQRASCLWLRETFADALEKFVKSRKENVITLRSGREIIALELDDIDVSATEVRKKLRNNLDVKKFLPPALVEYLNERGLYKRTSPLVKDYKTFATDCAGKALDKKALALKVYDMTKKNSYADFSVICSATSSRHAASIAEGIIESVKEEVGLKPISIEGLREGQWVLIDYGPVVIHVFQDAVEPNIKLKISGETAGVFLFENSFSVDRPQNSELA